MNLADTIQVEGFHAQMTVSQETFTHLLSGLNMTGVVEVLPTIDPRLELGSDTREFACLHVIRSENLQVLNIINQEDRLQKASVPITTWIFVRRDDNPADVVTKMWIVKLGPADA